MFKKFKEFADKRPVYITKEGRVYSYNGNTIAYFDISDKLKESINSNMAFTSIEKCSSIEDILKLDSKVDEEPFSFDFDIKIYPEKVTSTKLVKIFSSFNKFYNTESFRTELSGIHVKGGSIFATDSYILKLSKIDLVGKDANMVIDINPMLDYLDINTKKIASTNKSLFKSNAVKNDEITIGYIDSKTDSGLYLNIDGLNFLIISICESNLDFSYIKNFKPNNKLTVHTQNLLKEVSKILENPTQDKLDICKDMVKFDVSDKLNISIYEYTGESTISTILGTKANSNDVFVVNGRRLIEMLKEIKDSTVDITLNKEKTMLRINSQTNKNLLALAGSILK